MNGTAQLFEAVTTDAVPFEHKYPTEPELVLSAVIVFDCPLVIVVAFEIEQEILPVESVHDVLAATVQSKLLGDGEGDGCTLDWAL